MIFKPQQITQAEEIRAKRGFYFTKSMFIQLSEDRCLTLIDEIISRKKGKRFMINWSTILL